MPGIEASVNADWGPFSYFNHFTSNARGVAILINSDVDFKINGVKREPTGNMLAMSMSIYNFDITLICLYGPNDDSPQFYTDIKSIILDFNDTHCIICGDWNLVLDFD